MFTGFGIKYPEYEVITPANLSFHLRSMTVQEEEKMKASLMTPSKTSEHLNKVLYELAVIKPPIVTDYTAFLKNTTLKDRDVLLYGLYHVTYDEIRNYDITCSSCRKQYPVTVKASSTFNMTMFPSNDILTKTYKVELPVMKGVSAIVKQPTLFDEFTAIRDLSSRPGSTIDVITETLIIDHFEQDIETQSEPKMITDRTDIIDAYFSLPALDKRAIQKKYEEEFGQYGLDLKMKSCCSHCGFEEVVTIDIVSNFFRALYEL
jgi:hypothetical protein